VNKSSPTKISKKWLKIADIYKKFAIDYPFADFSDSAAYNMYAYESHGIPLPDTSTNGYALGKKWMDVSIASWKEDIPQMGLLVSELVESGYPDWFLRRVGILNLTPTKKACSWWIS
jgi:hypothetical protein